MGTDSKTEPRPQAESQSGAHGIAPSQATNERDSKREQTPRAEIESDAPGMPYGSESVLLAISKEIVKATFPHHAKLRSLAYDTSPARFKVRQDGASTAQDVSSYITQAMLEAKMKCGNFEISRVE